LFLSPWIVAFPETTGRPSEPNGCNGRAINGKAWRFNELEMFDGAPAEYAPAICKIFRQQ